MVSSVVPSANPARINFIVSFLGDDAKEAADVVIDGNSTLPSTATPAEQALLPRVKFIDSLCIFFDDNYDVVRAIAKDPNVSSLRDVALNYDQNALARVIGSPPAVEAVPLAHFPHLL